MRHRDPALAARAAEAAYHRVAEGPRIRYDDRFDATDPSTLFCSEVPGWAFGALVGEPVFQPFDATTLPSEGGLMAALGVTATHTTAPSDLMFDPRFALVGEWRDVAALGTMRRHDAVMESLYRWMEEDGYRLHPSFAERATGGLGRLARETPLLGLAVDDRLSKGLHTSFLVNALSMDNVARALDAALTERLGDGPVPTRDVLLAEIEALRVADAARSRKDARFHRTLHP